MFLPHGTCQLLMEVVSGNELSSPYSFWLTAVAYNGGPGRISSPHAYRMSLYLSLKNHNCNSSTKAIFAQCEEAVCILT